MLKPIIFFPIFLVIYLSSCATVHEYSELKNRLDAVDIQLKSMGVDSKQLTSSYSLRIANSINSQEKMSSDLAKINGEIDALKQGVVSGQMPGISQASAPNVSQRISLLEAKVKNLEERNNVSPVQSVVSTQQYSAPDFNSVEKSFKTSDWQKVISGFENDLKSAQLDIVEKRKRAFYLGQSFYHTKQFDLAAIQYSEYLKISPRGAYVSRSKLHLGDCFRELGDKETAKIYYKELVRLSKSSVISKQAKSRLDML